MAKILKKTIELESSTKIIKIKMSSLLHNSLFLCGYAIVAVCLVLMSSCSTSTKQKSDTNTSTQIDSYSESPNINTSDYSTSTQIDSYSEYSDINTSDYSTSHKYNAKYGNGSYNYDVVGADENGDYVYGNIDVDGKYGSGYIENENGEEIEIYVEWTGYGELEGTDDDGNVYYLEAD